MSVATSVQPVLLLQDVPAQVVLSWLPAPNVPCHFILLGLCRLWSPCLKQPSLTVCWAEASLPPDTDPESSFPAHVAFRRPLVISVLPGLTHHPTISAQTVRASRVRTMMS